MASSSGGTPTSPTDTRRRLLRIAFGCLLVLAFLGTVAWILIGSPMHLAPTVILILVAAASAAAFAAFFVPTKPSVRFKRAFTVGVAAIGLITTLIAVPALRDTERASQPAPIEPSTPSASTPSVSGSASPEQSDPIATTLELTIDCESFTVPASLLPSLPDGDQLEPQWVHEHGGATLDDLLILTVQGKSDEAVVLQRMRVVDLEIEPLPSKPVNIYLCEKGGGQVVRYFDIVLSDPPKVIPRPGDIPGEDGKTQPAAKFPFRVSKSDPEVFELYISGPPCSCSWRIALDWSSGGRTGTTYVDRGFGKIKNDTRWYDEKRPIHGWNDNAWHPPLPR